MTRIILRFFLVLVGGLLLLASGETAIPISKSSAFTEEYTSPHKENNPLFSTKPSFLPIEDDLSSVQSNSEAYMKDISTESSNALYTTIDGEDGTTLDVLPSRTDSKEMDSSMITFPTDSQTETEEVIDSKYYSSGSDENKKMGPSEVSELATVPMRNRSDIEKFTQKAGFDSTTNVDDENTTDLSSTDSRDYSVKPGLAYSASNEGFSEMDDVGPARVNSSGSSEFGRNDNIGEYSDNATFKAEDLEREGIAFLDKPVSTMSGPQAGMSVMSMHGKQQGSMHANHLEYAGSENVGVTFDPDGMTHDGPQDPDAVVFMTPDNSREVEPTGNYKSFQNLSKESEGLEMERESNVNEEKVIHNGEKEYENIYPVSGGPESEDVLGTLSALNPSVQSSTEKESTLPEFQIYNSTTRYNFENEEMMQDSPHSFGVNQLPEFTDKKPEESVSITEKQDPKNIPSSKIATPLVETNFESSSPASELASSQPDQSMIRPIKVIPSSPTDQHASTSGLLSTQSSLSNPSVPTTNSKIVDKESMKPETSSPIFILPEKIAGNVDVSTMITQPELVDSDKAEQSNETLNSTIPEIVVKTSVSVSLPSYNFNNGSLTFQQLPNENSSSNFSISSVDSPLMKENNDSISADALTTPATTEAASTPFNKIRKPKLRIGTTEDRPRQPFVPRRPAGGASTEAPAPVSIFKKTRTRIASITSSTTARPFRPYSTIRVHYATHHGMAIVPPAGEWIVSTEPVTTTTEPTTTTTEEPIEEVPFTDQTVMPDIPDDATEDVMLVKVAGYIALDRGIRWQDELDNRQTPEYKKNAEVMLMHLERLFRSSSIAPRLWKIEIDGFSGSRSVRPVGVDFFLYLVKSNPVFPDHLETVFREKLTENKTFATYRVDTDKTAFEVLQEEPLVKATPPPDDDEEGAEPPIPQWAIACIVIGAASLIFIVLFAAVTLYGRHHMRRRYSNKLSEELERSSGEWESKMAAAYENMAADTLYDADENTYKKQQQLTSGRIATFHGIPSPLKRGDSWSSTRRPPRWTSHFD